MIDDEIVKSLEGLRHEMAAFRKTVNDNAKENNFAATLVIFNTMLLFLILWRVW